MFCIFDDDIAVDHIYSLIFEGGERLQSTIKVGTSHLPLSEPSPNRNRQRALERVSCRSRLWVDNPGVDQIGRQKGPPQRVTAAVRPRGTKVNPGFVYYGWSWSWIRCPICFVRIYPNRTWRVGQAGANLITILPTENQRADHVR